jgi:topoisomerase-4 subunit B
MYIGGVDERALHHLAAEVLDNSPWTRPSPAMRTGSKSALGVGNRLTITDNGRGIPVDPHPKFPTSRRSKSS